MVQETLKMFSSTVQKSSATLISLYFASKEIDVAAVS